MIEIDNLKSTHIPRYFVIMDFVRFFKLINQLLSSNIDFIDLSISFPIIDFDRFVTPCCIYLYARSRSFIEFIEKLSFIRFECLLLFTHSPE